MILIAKYWFNVFIYKLIRRKINRLVTKSSFIFRFCVIFRYFRLFFSSESILSNDALPNFSLRVSSNPVSSFWSIQNSKKDEFLFIKSDKEKTELILLIYIAVGLSVEVRTWDVDVLNRDGRQTWRQKWVATQNRTTLETS